MQNARLTELERLLAKSSVSVGRGRSSDVKSSEEYNKIKEENRVVSELQQSSLSDVQERRQISLSSVIPVNGSHGCVATSS